MKQQAKYLHLVIAPLGILYDQWILEIKEAKFLKWKPEKEERGIELPNYSVLFFKLL